MCIWIIGKKSIIGGKTEISGHHFFLSRIFIKTYNLIQVQPQTLKVPEQTCWSFYQV